MRYIRHYNKSPRTAVHLDRTADSICAISNDYVKVFTVQATRST